jgi:hypothetical protein
MSAMQAAGCRIVLWPCISVEGTERDVCNIAVVQNERFVAAARYLEMSLVF